MAGGCSLAGPASSTAHGTGAASCQASVIVTTPPLPALSLSQHRATYLRPDLSITYNCPVTLTTPCYLPPPGPQYYLYQL